MSILLPHRLDFQFQFIFPLVPVFNVEWHFHDLRFFVCVWVAFDSLRVDYKKVLKYSGKQSWGLLPLKNYVFSSLSNVALSNISHVMTLRRVCGWGILQPASPMVLGWAPQMTSVSHPNFTCTHWKLESIQTVEVCSSTALFKPVGQIQPQWPWLHK